MTNAVSKVTRVAQGLNFLIIASTALTIGLGFPIRVAAAGLTIFTHGLNSTATNGWVPPMVDAVFGRVIGSGTGNASLYQVYVTYSGGFNVTHSARAPASGVISFTNMPTVNVPSLPPGLIAIERLAGGQVALAWDSLGNLQARPSLSGGSWTNVSTASPHVIPASGTQMYFRLTKTELIGSPGPERVVISSGNDLGFRRGWARHPIHR